MYSNMADAMEEDEGDWDQLQQPNWLGLGLTDPIKSVDVSIFMSLYPSLTRGFLG